MMGSMMSGIDDEYDEYDDVDMMIDIDDESH